MGEYVNKEDLVNAIVWDGSDDKYHEIRAAGKDIRADVKVYGSVLIIQTKSSSLVVKEGDVVIKNDNQGISIIEKKNFEKNFLKIK